MAVLTSTILVGASLAGTAVSYNNSRKQAKAVKKAGAVEAALGEQNAELAEASARDAIALGVEAASRQRQTVRGVVGSQRAALAAQGVDLGDGDAGALQQESVQLGELDVLTIKNNAARQAWGYQVEATNYRNQAKLARMGASNQAAGIRSGGTQTLLTGGVQAYDIYRGVRRR